MKFLSANRIAPDWTPRFAASHLGLFCSHMSHKKDVKIIWANEKIIFKKCSSFASSQTFQTHVNAVVLINSFSAVDIEKNK